MNRNDDHGAFSNALRAITVLKDTKAYELLARSYISLGLVYSNQDNPQTSVEIDETAYQLVRKHRIHGPERRDPSDRKDGLRCRCV